MPPAPTRLIFVRQSRADGARLAQPTPDAAVIAADLAAVVLLVEGVIDPQRSAPIAAIELTTGAGRKSCEAITTHAGEQRVIDGAVHPAAIRIARADVVL